MFDCAEVIPVKEKSVKHITKTFAIVSLLIPMSAQPLGIGDIKLHSALNQTLNAEIRLSLAPGENPADISVKLAPPEKFDKAGVPWNYFLSKIKFQPKIQADGSVIIQITSREPLTEPFLDFLLEVNWPQGSQFREFTVLVDPPTAYKAPTIPSAASNSYQIEPLDDYYSSPAKRSQSSKKRVTQVKLASNISPATPSSGEYGPTQTADTLWHIAEQLGSERNVPTRNMMAALFRANPDAFNRGNVDSLKTGVVLKIPETEAIIQSSDQVTKPKSAQKAAAAPAKTSPSSTKSLELVAPTDARVTDTSDISGQVKPGQDSSDTRQPATANGSADGKDLELQSRIERLEQQLNMMQQLLALKDQQLSALQSNNQEAAQQAATDAQNLPSPGPITPPATESQATPTPTQPPVADTNQPPAAAKPAPLTAKPKPVKAPPPTPIVEDESFLSAPSYLVTVGGFTVGILGLLGWLLWRKRKIESQTNTESMFATASQIRMPDADNSSLSVPVMDMSSASGAYDVGTVGESSFISDFTPSDFEAFDTDQNEIDPLSEADVYLAYGRYQQAEDLIRNAIKEQPAKDDYKLKLLEIFYANENKEDFSAYAQELSDAGKATNIPFWSKVTDMARDIIPESALFGSSDTPATNKPNPSKQAESKLSSEDTETSEPANFDLEDDFALDKDFSNDDLIDLGASSLPDMALMDDVDSEIAELQLNEPELAQADDNSLDFDLSSFSDDKDTQQSTETGEAASDIESIDFDLSDLNADSTDLSDTPEKTDTDSLEGFDFDFDFDSSEDTAEEIKASDNEPLDMATLESFEFPTFDADEKESEPAKPSPEIELGESADDFDFNFDFDTPIKSGDDEEIELGVSDLTDMDEFETKIDLAKAYIDMGDEAAAMSIAEEVLEKGNSEQKQAAQALLDELK